MSNKPYNMDHDLIRRLDRLENSKVVMTTGHQRAMNLLLYGNNGQPIGLTETLRRSGNNLLAIYECEIPEHGAP